MLDIATEITVSVMSFNVGTTILVQAAGPIDNSTDCQAAGVYKHYSLMTSPYLLLVTGSLRSNLSRAFCTAQVGMSYRLIRGCKICQVWAKTRKWHLPSMRTIHLIQDILQIEKACYSDNYMQTLNLLSDNHILHIFSTNIQIIFNVTRWKHISK